MQLWKANRLDGEFTAEPAEIAAQFAEWRKEQPAHYRHGMRLERQLRDWMTRQDGLNSSWTDESDATGFGAIFNAAYDLLYATARA